MQPELEPALVLGGGAARGAYEVGVLDYIFRNVSKDIGRKVHFDILCGHSVGAIHACYLAAFADSMTEHMPGLIERWTHLRVAHVLQVNTTDVWQIVKGLIPRSKPRSKGGHPGLFNPAGLHALLASAIPFRRIGPNLREGHLRALSVAATHIRNGRSVLFIQGKDLDLAQWRPLPTLETREAFISVEHALGSASIPLLFPPVRIEHEYFCDGGIRQDVPLAPAQRLGCNKILVVNPRYIAPASTKSETSDQEPGYFFMLGKTLNALLLDRVDIDLDRMEQINRILDAGTALYGDDFVHAINKQLNIPLGPAALRPIQAVKVRASRDIGKLSSEFARSSTFLERVPGILGRFFRSIAESAEDHDSDLLSYLLFDGEFAEVLIDLGRQDAKAQHEQLCALFAG